MPVANKIASLLYIKTLIVFDIVFFGTIPVVSYLLVILGESFNFDVPVFFEWFGRWIGLWFMPFDVFVMGAGGACLLGPFVITGILLIFLSGVLAWKGSLTGFYFLFFLITVSSVIQPFGIYIQNYYININGGTVDLFSPTLVSRVVFSFWVITIHAIFLLFRGDRLLGKFDDIAA